MGMFDFFRRRRDRESVESAIGEIQGGGGSVSLGATPERTGAQAQEIGGAWQNVLGAIAGTGSSVPHQSIDLRNVSGLRDDVMAALRQAGVDPEDPGQVDASAVPGLQESLMKAFASNGIDFEALTGAALGEGAAIAGGGASGPVTDAGAVKAQLDQLDQLKAQGVLSDAEYRQQRRRVLDQL